MLWRILGKTAASMIRHRRVHTALILLLLSVGILSTFSAYAAQDVSDSFEVAYSARGTVEPGDVLSDAHVLSFTRVHPPQSIVKGRQDIWLRTTLNAIEVPGHEAVLEIPGHLFSRVTAWFRLVDGSVVEQQAGRAVPLDDRTLQLGGVAFRIPENQGQPIPVLIKMKVGVPVNFSALLWEGERWRNQVVNQRLWFGVFLGGILVLILYNLFIAAVLRDRSYFYYAGYMVALTLAVISYTSLPEEIVFRDGLNRMYVLPIAGIAVFFAVHFVNVFLDVRKHSPLAWRLSTVVAYGAAIFGLLLAFRLYLVPPDWNGNLMHLCLVLGGVYYLGISVVSYFQGVREARFLALSVLAVLSGLTLYLGYTYAWVPYHPVYIHAVEAGALLEGILLSLALADRVNQMARQKDQLEKSALSAQQVFSRRLLDAQEAERERFSAAMHDSVGHGMLVLKQNLEQIGTRLQEGSGKSDESEAQATLLCKQVDYCSDILNDVRGLSHDLHPHLLRRLGLRAALESTMERAFSGTGIEWDAEITDLPATMSKEHQITLYRVTQECINNILKHADASEVILLAEAVSGSVVVRIKDDGRGFQTDDASFSGLGLSGMRERMELFGGWFQVQSQADHGTQVSFGLPLIGPSSLSSG